MNDNPERWTYLAEGNARQARKRVAADVVIRDSEGRVLLVNPTYKEFWDLPGGMAEENEPPRTAARRELLEELGLTITPGDLLAVEWVGPHGPWDDQLIFVFDAGTLDDARIANLHPTDPELHGWTFATRHEAVRLLRADIAQLLQRALFALDHGTTHYAEHD